VANQVAIATVVIARSRALVHPAPLATLDLGERFTVHHKSKADSDLAGWDAAAARDGIWWEGDVGMSNEILAKRIRFQVCFGTPEMCGMRVVTVVRSTQYFGGEK